MLVVTHHRLHVPLQFAVQVRLLSAEDIDELAHHHDVALHLLQVVPTGQILGPGSG